MTVRAAAGTTLAVSLQVPATFDALGYVALPWTLCGEVTNLGELGREYAKIEHKQLGRRGTGKRKGGWDEGAATVAFATDDEDAGQLLLAAGVDSYDDCFFRVEFTTGVQLYFPAQIMSFRTASRERDGLVSGSVTLELTTINGIGMIIVVIDSNAPLPSLDFTEPLNSQYL